MMTDIAPDGVIVVETVVDVDAALFPVEAAAIDRAVEARRREFTTVRYCARQALNRLGLPHTPVLSRRPGGPQWPAGIVGSLTHCAGYRAAALAWAQDVLAVGVDAEPHQALPEGVTETVLSPSEIGWVNRMPSSVHWDRVVFSIKEAVFKAWNPLTGQWLDFHDAVVTCAEDGTFCARLIGTHMAGDGIRGRWMVDRDLILSMATLSLQDRASSGGPT